MTDNILLEIWGEILLRLPAKSLIRLRSVCKSWRHVIDDPIFVRAHTNHHLSSSTILIHRSTGSHFFHLYSLDLQTLNPTNNHQPTIAATPISLTRLKFFPSDIPVTGCDGLMLISPDPRVPEIWNPLTHERLKLPELRLESRVVAKAIGLNHATDDYEVVLIDRDADDEKYLYQTHVYSLKSDSWRKVMNYPSDDKWGPEGEGVFLSGALHWISRDKIIVLDLGTERYGEMEMPPLRKTMRKETGIRQHNYLDTLSGHLIVSDYEKDGYKGSERFDVWVMKDYGARDSWIKLFSLDLTKDGTRDLGRSLRPIAYMKNKTRVLLQGLRDHKQYYLFDDESNSLKTAVVQGLSQWICAQIFQGSIFRLHGNCGVSKSVVTERRIN